MNPYCNSGYEKDNGRWFGFAETLTVMNDVLALTTRRDTEGVVCTLVELIDGKATCGSDPDAVLANFTDRNPYSWLNRLPDWVAIPAFHLMKMAEYRFLIDAYPAKHRKRFILQTARKQLVRQVLLSL